MSEKTTKKKPGRRKADSPFGPNLEKLLQDRGISQRSASDIAQVSPSVLNQWLAGSTPLDLLAVQRLSRGLGVDFEYLLTGESSPAGNLAVSEIFDSEEAPELTGMFELKARRLIKKEQDDG